MDPSELEATELASARYLQLIQQLQEELGDDRGWQARAAERLGVSPGYLNLVYHGRRRNIGVRALRAACESMPLDPEFFTVNSEPDYFPDDPNPIFQEVLYEDYLIETGVERRQSTSRRAAPSFESSGAEEQIGLVNRTSWGIASIIAEQGATRNLVEMLLQTLQADPVSKMVETTVRAESLGTKEFVSAGAALAQAVMERWKQVPNDALDAQLEKRPSEQADADDTAIVSDDGIPF